jgi:hypothetical protein
MFSAAGRVPTRSLICLAACFVVAAVLQGCSKNQTAESALDAQLSSAKISKQALAKFAGKVLVDGQPVTAKDLQVVVILNNANHLDENAHAAVPKLYEFVHDDGSFSFHTYEKGDGVPAGKYVVTFIEFHLNAHGRFRTMALRGPDELKNLYSDPDKNKDIPDFNIDLTAPGKTDYEFNLAVAGKEGPSQPGPNAVTQWGTAH